MHSILDLCGEACCYFNGRESATSWWKASIALEKKAALLFWRYFFLLSLQGLCFLQVHRLTWAGLMHSHGRLMALTIEQICHIIMKPGPPTLSSHLAQAYRTN